MISSARTKGNFSRFGTVARLSPSKKSNESPGKNEPKIVAVSKKMMSATPHTAKLPRFAMIVSALSQFNV